MTERKRLISICVPVFNEESNIEPLYSALLPIMDQLSERYEFELLFTDRHSTDRTFEYTRKPDFLDEKAIQSPDADFSQVVVAHGLDRTDLDPGGSRQAGDPPAGDRPWPSTWPHVIQRAGDWCGAACGEMAAGRLGVPVSHVPIGPRWAGQGQLGHGGVSLST